MPAMRVFAAFFLAVAAMVAARPEPADAQMNGSTVRSFVAALNTDNQQMIDMYLAPNFQLSFAGGASYSGQQAKNLLLNFDRPITIVSVTPRGQQNASMSVGFNNSMPYDIDYVGARGRMIASMTIQSGNP